MLSLIAWSFSVGLLAGMLQALGTNRIWWI
jgi:hypothetical protein